MQLIPKEYAEAATYSSLASANPCEDARTNKLLKGIFNRRKPSRGICSYAVPHPLSHVALKAVQEMINYDCGIKFSKIVVEGLKLRIDYRTKSNCQYVPELQEIITLAQCRIDRIVHQRVLASQEKRRGLND